MQINEAVEVVEELHPARTNHRLAGGWTLLAVVPGYDHYNAQAVACNVLGKPAERRPAPFLPG
ncbi:hypothetical protein [Pseudomonas siliginis]|uniref:hypothetical protein n=1 Tax=Pseudomonas siliginis TaxID=2842346 RepID=UPI0020925C58|nr:hypothetical protein [Pseudomonas siliginis]UST93743.1 hypothetical protein NF679_17270 [Pseudomonas siliginis]